MNVTVGGTYTTPDANGNQVFHKIYVELEEVDWQVLRASLSLSLSAGEAVSTADKYQLMRAEAERLVIADLISKGVLDRESAMLDLKHATEARDRVAAKYR